MTEEIRTIDRAAIEALRQQHIGRLFLNAQRNYSLQALTKLSVRGHEGLSLAHTNLLAHLDVEGTRITTLAERVGVSKQAIGEYLVRDLEEKGYIVREVDSHDRRAAVITYTPAGWTFLQDAHDVKREIEAEYTETLGAQGMDHLRHLLRQLVSGHLRNNQARMNLTRTSYPDINAVLHLLLKEVRSALGEHFVGLYLHGSLASGNFDPERSDVDFVVVTADALPDALIPALAELHSRIIGSGMQLGDEAGGHVFSTASATALYAKRRAVSVAE